MKKPANARKKTAAKTERPPAASEILTDELFERPGHLIRRISQIITALFLEETRGFELTQLQYLVLRSIKYHPGASQRRLADYIALDRTTVGWIIGSLEKKNLLKITPDRVDRRQKAITITTPGLDIIERIEPHVKRLQERIIAPLSKPERRRFLETLKTIAETYNEYSRAPLRKDRA